MDPTARSAQGSRQNSENRADEDSRSNAQNTSPDRKIEGESRNGQRLSPEKIDKIKAAFKQKGGNKINMSNKKLM